MAITRVRWKRGTAADWASANPVLRLAEPGWETDTGKFKVGDGITAWNDLDYVNTGTTGGGGDIPGDTHAATSKTSLADLDEIPLIDSAASFGLKKMLGSTLKTVINGQLGSAIHIATTKATPVDADEFGYSDSAASNAPKRLTWSNLKAALKAQISLDGWAAPTADVSLASHKLTNVTNGTNNQDAATVSQLNSGLGSKLDTGQVQDTVLGAFNGMAMFVLYDTATSNWPTIDPTLAADSRAGWIYLFSDEGDPPPGSPTVAGPRIWARLVG
jgi:hypothetical protein